ncbi:MAG: hypothetical protein U0587_16580 [Candidatus Binatia bacterium]
MEPRALALTEAAPPVTPVGPLRPHQRQCLERLHQRYRERRRRLLVLAHREELLEQARARFHDADPTLAAHKERAAALRKAVRRRLKSYGR